MASERSQAVASYSVDSQSSFRPSSPVFSIRNLVSLNSIGSGPSCAGCAKSPHLFSVVGTSFDCHSSSRMMEWSEESTGSVETLGLDSVPGFKCIKAAGSSKEISICVHSFSAPSTVSTVYGSGFAFPVTKSSSSGCHTPCTRTVEWDRPSAGSKIYRGWLKFGPDRPDSVLDSDSMNFVACGATRKSRSPSLASRRRRR